MSKEIKNISFEEALKELESIVQKLESGQVKLEEAVEAYEKGSQMQKICEEKLKEAQMKVEKLILNKEGKAVGKEPLDETIEG
ncbi:MAG: exodeoxyribonuclease VII small subunit [Alphaproteobacteria bacterium]|nr:exodeoxyribonuclease VII small subunit [Alphaproteobacteria bacterium]